MGAGDDNSRPERPRFKLGATEWDQLLKRYVWDDETTPYFVPVARLTRRQARHELKAYAIFLGFLFGIAAVVTLSAQAPGGRSAGMSLYSFTVVCAAVLLGVTRQYPAALYCSTAPLGTLAWFLLFAQHARLGGIDYVVIVVFALFWMRYGLRVIAIARAYEAMAEGEEPPGTRRHWGRRR